MLIPFLSRPSQSDIIPVVNVKTRQKFEERLRQLAKFSGLFQIDVADGVFTPWKNWNSPEELKTFKRIRGRFELHLMVQNLETMVPLWLETKPRRIIVHWEAIKDFEVLKKMCQEAKVELALALNPDTSLDAIKPFLKIINYLVFLSVNPGPSGQKFEWYVLDKIQELRKQNSIINIEVDGGINEGNILEIAKAGVNYFAIGSAIFDSPHPQEKILALQKVLYENKEKNR